MIGLLLACLVAWADLFDTCGLELPTIAYTHPSISSDLTMLHEQDNYTVSRVMGRRVVVKTPPANPYFGMTPTTEYNL